jgi:hypothetical protein
MDECSCAKCDVHLPSDLDDYTYLFNDSGDTIHICGRCVPLDAEHGAPHCVFCHDLMPDDLFTNDSSSDTDDGSDEDNDPDEGDDGDEPEPERWFLCFDGFNAQIGMLCERCYPEDDRASNVFKRLQKRLSPKRRRPNPREP